jgi:hypothetical protein
MAALKKLKYYHNTIPFNDGSFTVDFCNSYQEYMRGDLWVSGYVIELIIVPGKTSANAMDEWYSLTCAMEDGYLGY